MGEYKGKRPRCKARQLREWEQADSELLHIEARALFGEESYLQEYMAMGIFTDILGGSAKKAARVELEDEDFEKRFPVLFALMAINKDDEGKDRIPCTITIVCEDGQAKCGINERNHNLSLWISAGSIGGVFAALEEAMGQRPVPWRKVAWKGGKKST